MLRRRYQLHRIHSEGRPADTSASANGEIENQGSCRQIVTARHSDTGVRDSPSTERERRPGSALAAPVHRPAHRRSAQRGAPTPAPHRKRWLQPTDTLSQHGNTAAVKRHHHEPGWILSLRGQSQGGPPRWTRAAPAAAAFCSSSLPLRRTWGSLLRLFFQIPPLCNAKITVMVLEDQDLMDLPRGTSYPTR